VAEHGNTMRFCVLDLILGRVGRDHLLHGFLARYGMGDQDVAWFKEHAARLDVLGLDYYSQSELAWTKHGHAAAHPVARFGAVALDYAERYRCPVMLSETNLRGTLDDRIGWLRFMVEQSAILQERLKALGLPFEGFCWYPYIDSTDWDSLVREARRNIDPQEIYWLDASFNRNPSALSEIYAALARGTMEPSDIPVRPVGDAVLDGRGVRNFLPLMN
jgi:hypothetical protein